MPKLKSKKKGKVEEDAAMAEDEVSLQLKEERARALSILDTMLSSQATPPKMDEVEESDTDIDSASSAQEEEQEEEAKCCINTDLKELFSSTDGYKGFSFLTEQEPDSDTTHATQHEPTPTPTSEEQAPANTTQKCFFFHSDSKTLRNRLDENSFHRSSEWAELQEAWPSRRTAMKESFRRRRKDAIRLSRKRRQPFRTTT